MNAPRFRTPWRYLPGALLLIALGMSPGQHAQAQDLGTLNPVPLPPLTQPDGPKTENLAICSTALASDNLFSGLNMQALDCTKLKKACLHHVKPLGFIGTSLAAILREHVTYVIVSKNFLDPVEVDV